MFSPGSKADTDLSRLTTERETNSLKFLTGWARELCGITKETHQAHI